MPSASNKPVNAERCAIVFLNGASGSGKTTLASFLHEHYRYHWFHPDGRWDTSSMDQKVLTHDCIRFVRENFQETVVVDSQLRQEYLDDCGDESPGVTQVLLDCDDVDRVSRLQLRKWPANEIDAHILWASFLRTNAASNHVPIINTSAATIEAIAIEVNRLIRQFEDRVIE